MKQGLLFLGLIAGISASAQITIDDTLYVGDAIVYYNLDSNATNLAATTGAAVTWDYSTIAGYNGSPTHADDITAASGTAYASDYSTANYCEELTDGVWTFFTNDDALDETHVHGFVYNDGTTEFIITYEVDDLKAMVYPMNLSDTYTDPIEGTASIPTLGNVAVTGDATVTADGTGTLLIGTNTYSNVIRIHTDEESSGTFFGQTIVISRESFVYYDLSSANPMPIFRHDAVEADLDAGGLYGFSAIYSKDQVSNFVGMEKNEAVAFSVYPNPSTDVITIETPSATSQISIVNSNGQVVKSISSTQLKETVDVSSLESGIYIVTVSFDGTTSSQSITIR